MSNFIYNAFKCEYLNYLSECGRNHGHQEAVINILQQLVGDQRMRDLQIIISIINHFNFLNK